MLQILLCIIIFNLIIIDILLIYLFLNFKKSLSGGLYGLQNLFARFDY